MTVEPQKSPHSLPASPETPPLAPDGQALTRRKSKELRSSHKAKTLTRRLEGDKRRARRQGKEIDGPTGGTAAQGGFPLPASIAEGQITQITIKSIERSPVSIIVTARNYGRFLRECLESCLAQTVPACEVIYSDDASDDDSIEVARKILFPTPQATSTFILGSDHHEGVAAARHRGVLSSHGDLLVHVDGDDILQPDFLDKHLAAITPNTPFVYGPAQAFGLHDSLWAVQPWSEKNIWEMNFVNTSSMIWRWAYDAAGGWRETPPKTMWDWDLFLRASRLGGCQPKPSEATLLYRQHSESYGHTHEEEWTMDGRAPMLAGIRKSNVRLTVGLIYSGRVPGLLDEWLDRLEKDTCECGLFDRVQIIVLDNSPQSHRPLDWKFSTFLPYIIIPFKQQRHFSTERQRRDGVSRFMAAASNRILAESTGELIHFREDDTIPPPGGFKKMFDWITDGHPLRPSVAGTYLNRHPCGGYVGGWQTNVPLIFRDIKAEDLGLTENANSPLPVSPPPLPLRVDFCGTGCLLFWKDLCPREFPSHLGSVPAHDWAWGIALKASGKELYVLPDVICKHYKTETEYVT